MSLITLQCASGGGGENNTNAVVTCTAPQVLQDGACITPIPVCTLPQVPRDGVCVTPELTCALPEILQDGECVRPPEGTFAVVWGTGFYSTITAIVSQTLTAWATVTDGTLASCTASSLPRGFTFEKVGETCLLSGTFSEYKDATTYTFTATSTGRRTATADINLTVICPQGYIAKNGICFTGGQDQDHNGFIEILNLTQLDNIRNSLNGKWYSATGSAPVTSGCPNGGVCRGYELFTSLDFTSSKWASDCASDCIQEGWEPIGNAGSPFSTTLQGNTFAIRNLYINRTNREVAGLFGSINHASIANINLTNVWVSLANTGNFNAYAGSLVGRQENSDLTNINANGRVSANTNVYSIYVGGLVGNLYTGYIFNSNANVIVNAHTSRTNGEGPSAGGLVGFMSYTEQPSNNPSTNSYIIGSSSRGSINCTSANNSVPCFAGGMVGYKGGGSINYSFATGNVDSNVPNTNIGGLVGFNAGDIKNSYASGNVTSNNADVSKKSAAGGLVGLNGDHSNIINCYAMGDITASNSNTGGLIGSTSELYNTSFINIRNSYATGLVNTSSSGTSELNAGGLLGSNAISNLAIYNSYATNTVIANNSGASNTTNTGGLVGRISGGSINNSYASGGITASGTGVNNRGGFIGYKVGGSISSSYWDTKITSGCGSGSCTNATGLSTDDLQAASDDTNYPANLGTCFQYNTGKYPKLFTLNEAGTGCTSELLGGTNRTR